MGYTGDVFANIEATGSQSANLSCAWNDFSNIQGSFYGSVKIAGFVRTDIEQHPGIGQLTVDGDIGDAQNPVSISCEVIRALTATNIYADLNTVYYLSGTTQVPFNEYSRISDVVATGDFVGSVLTGTLAPNTFSGGTTQRFNITGDLDADITVLDSLDSQCGTDPASVVVGGSIVAGRTITIGGTLHSGNSTSGEGGLSLATNGLQGQVIVNATGTDGQWDGPVTIGTSPLTQSVTGVYDASSSTVGGGAVGLVPYHLYASDCFPRHDDNWLISTSEPYIMNSELNGTRPDPNGGFLPKVPVKMSFYGPIAPSSTSPPVRVWIWLHNTYWMDVTDHCDVSISGRSISISAASGHTLSAGYYAALAQTSPGPDALVCLGTFASTPPSVAPNTLDASGNPVAQYNFYVFPDCDSNGVVDSAESGQYCGPCVADCDDGTGTGTPDGGVTIDDLLYYYAEFQNGSIFADIDDGSGTGVTDGGVTIDDLLYYLTRFYAGC